MNNLNFLLFACAIFFSCSKSDNPIRYKGEVVSQPNYCTSSTGFPFIIKYLNTANPMDSIITTTLPTQYKLLGLKIEFSERDVTSQDEVLLCNDLYNIPKQVVVFNVKSQ
jgi:hypothetical protein